MPKAIHIANARQRDAEVAVEIVPQKRRTHTVLPDGRDKINVKLLKSTVELDFANLSKKFSDPVEFGENLLVNDPEVDMEIIGKIIRRTRKLFVDEDNRIVYRLNLFRVIRNPDGTEKEVRDLNRLPANVNVEVPLKWTGRRFKKSAAIRDYVFFRKYQLRHINGVTFDFLYNMAKELDEHDELMLIGAGKKGTDPILLTRGGTPYRAFLEGRVEGESYMLILHFADMEIKALKP